MSWQDVKKTFDGWPANSNGESLLTAEQKHILVDMCAKILERGRMNGMQGKSLSEVVDTILNSDKDPSNPLHSWCSYDLVYAAVERALRNCGANIIYSLGTKPSNTLHKELLDIEEAFVNHKLTPAQLNLLRALAVEPLGLHFNELDKRVVKNLISMGYAELRKNDSNYVVKLYITKTGLKYFDEQSEE